MKNIILTRSLQTTWNFLVLRKPQQSKNFSIMLKENIRLDLPMQIMSLTMPYILNKTQYSRADLLYTFVPALTRQADHNIEIKTSHCYFYHFKFASIRDRINLK